MTVTILEEAGIPAQLGRVSLNGIRGLLLLDKIDAYWEYTGTALVRYHNRKDLSGLDALEELRHLDEHRVVWMDPLPVNNSYILLARDSFIQKHDIQTISELAKHIEAGGQSTLCSNSEWFPSPDGLDGLQKAYGFEWPSKLRIGKPLALLYEDPDDCDVLVGYATDPRLTAFEWRILKDDRGFFPEYLPTLVFREDVYRELKEKHGRELTTVQQRLACIAEHLDITTMRKLIEVEESGVLEAEEVANRFLEKCPAEANTDVQATRLSHTEYDRAET